MSDKFIDRNEVSVIKEWFKSALVRHNGIAILLSGPAGVGKTKIAEQAIKESLEDEVLHVQHLRGFKPERDCIRVDCSENRADQPYEAFIAFRPVKEFYAKRQKGLRILKNGVSVVLAFFGINDVLETMRQFALELPRGAEASQGGISLSLNLTPFARYWHACLHVPPSTQPAPRQKRLSRRRRSREAYSSLHNPYQFRC
jgi:hypothetical protein